MSAHHRHRESPPPPLPPQGRPPPPPEEMPPPGAAFAAPLPAAFAAPLPAGAAGGAAAARWRGGRVRAAPAAVAAGGARAELAPRPGRDFHGIPNPAAGEPLRLGDLRERLIRQEETIIFALIERAQFRLNPVIYEAGAFLIPGAPDEGGGLSFSRYVLYGLERVYARVRRYTSPDEVPFAPAGSLPAPVLAPLDYPRTLIPNAINYNGAVEAVYRDRILPVVCEGGDDQNYGSSATADVAALQALSKRVHYGKFIAEAKFQESPREYAALAAAGDRGGIWALLSNAAVERVLLARVENKARNYGGDVTDAGTVRDVFKVEPAAIAAIYRDHIIPLTKEVEVDYIVQRARLLDG